MTISRPPAQRQKMIKARPKTISNLSTTGLGLGAESVGSKIPVMTRPSMTLIKMSPKILFDIRVLN